MSNNSALRIVAFETIKRSDTKILKIDELSPRLFMVLCRYSLVLMVRPLKANYFIDHRINR